MLICFDLLGQLPLHVEDEPYGYFLEARVPRHRADDTGEKEKVPFRVWLRRWCVLLFR